MIPTSVLPALFLVATSPVLARDAAQDERDVLQAERALSAAFEAEDADWLEQHLDPDFTLTNSRGVVTTRAQEAAELRSGTIQYTVFRNHDSKVRLYGDTAVVIGITSVEGTSGGEAFKLAFRFTDVYVRRPEEWVMVAGHASRLEATPATP